MSGASANAGTIYTPSYTEGTAALKSVAGTNGRPNFTVNTVLGDNDLMMGNSGTLTGFRLGDGGAVESHTHTASSQLVAATRPTTLPGVGQILPPVVTYVHLQLERHEIFCANGAQLQGFQPAERVLDALKDGPRVQIAELFPAFMLHPANHPAARLTLKAHEAEVLL